MRAFLKHFVDGYLLTDLWDLQKFHYTWPTQDMTSLYRNFTAEQYITSAKSSGISHAVFVQVLNGHLQEAGESSC